MPGADMDNVHSIIYTPGADMDNVQYDNIYNMDYASANNV